MARVLRMVRPRLISLKIIYGTRSQNDQTTTRRVNERRVFDVDVADVDVGPCSACMVQHGRLGVSLISMGAGDSASSGRSS